MPEPELTRNNSETDNVEQFQQNEIARILERDRKELLDLTFRNRLLNVPRRKSRSKTLEIIEELSQEIFRILVLEGKNMYFAPIPEPEGDEEQNDIEESKEKRNNVFFELPQPEDEEIDELGRAKRHTDNLLQTPHKSELLQKRLLSLYFDARTYQEEQGVNVLYLALGFLKFFEDKNSDTERWAPLILLPVSLERKSVGERFKVSYNDEDIATNLSLKEKLKHDFGLELPEIQSNEDFSPKEYFEEVRKAIEKRRRWEVFEDDMVLGFFSFAKFLMYRDLSPDSWPNNGLTKHGIIKALLQEGYPESDSLFGEDEKLDKFLKPNNTFHVLDSDSSQSLAIEEVRKGNDLIIQGPPGTGKSQTIANLIASAVQDGKKVLFLAEKRAALEVVKRRLENIGLGDICLELHSHKANKKQVLSELENTISLGAPQSVAADKPTRELTKIRDELNLFVEKLHTPLEPSHLTPFRILGTLVKTSALGLSDLDLSFNKALKWEFDEIQERAEALSEFSNAIELVGVPSKHAWKGVGLEIALPDDIIKIQSQTTELIDQINTFITKFNQMKDQLVLQGMDTIEESLSLFEVTKLYQDSIDFDYAAINSDLWTRSRNEISSLIDTGLQFIEDRDLVNSVFSELSWDTNMVETRVSYASNIGNVFRFLNPSYWKAKGYLKGLLKVPVPDDGEAIKLIDTLIRAQKGMGTIKENASLGNEAFKSYWKNENSDWQQLKTVFDWDSLISNYYKDRDYLDVANSRTVLNETLEDANSLEAEIHSIKSKLSELANFIKLDIKEAFEAEELPKTRIDLILERLNKWMEDLEGITKWIGFRNSWISINSLDLGDLPRKAYNGEIDNKLLRYQFKHILYTQVFRDFASKNPEFGSFDGALYSEKLSRFCSLDTKRIELARSIVASTHYESIPKGNQSIGGIGIIKGEIQKKRRHMPVRKLLKNAGPAVQAIKPVFMMSPMSVAQYLEPGAISFDLLLIDEASQVQPIDALGAVARSKQIVVVGDSRQLPPTRFFSGVNDDLDDEEDDGLSAGDMESILGLCEAQGIPSKMLKWHYRSRHHSLIAPSNHLFYKDGLYLVPSPYPANENLGVQFIKLNGIYDRGKSRTNQIEAKAVAEACINHARNNPHLTLGVAAFSSNQQTAIQNELELLFRENPDVHEFFGDSGPEPFFVKNLENVQGDERDVIFLSIGYARDESGYMAMNFGPLTKEGGQRRLNVLVTRAKQKCVVFSSITSDDIDLERTQSEGARALKVYLNFAETGKLPIAEVTGKDFDSEFEIEVANQLLQQGYEVEPQLGVAGFFIDLAVKDPKQPGSYLLAVECDGAAYHSSRSARDRDRLRQQVLEDHGWVVHRIWSTDWFYRPQDEIRKLLAALETAKTKKSTRKKSKPDESQTVSREEPTLFEHKEESIPYTESKFKVDTSLEPHEVRPGTLTDIIIKIIETEGPIHQDEVARRVADLWGLKKAGNRINKISKDAIRRALKRTPLTIEKKGEFCHVIGKKIELRDRSNVKSYSLKKAEMIPPIEIQQGIVEAIEEYVGISQTDAVHFITRRLGFTRAGPQLNDTVKGVIKSMLMRHIIEATNGVLHLKES